jgi:hypothetical protein
MQIAKKNKEVGIKEFIEEIYRLNIRPTIFGLEYSYNWLESMPEIAQCIDFFNEISIELAQRG